MLWTRGPELNSVTEKRAISELVLGSPLHQSAWWSMVKPLLWPTRCVDTFIKRWIDKGQYQSIDPIGLFKLYSEVAITVYDAPAPVGDSPSWYTTRRHVTLKNCGTAALLTFTFLWQGPIVSRGEPQLTDQQFVQFFLDRLGRASAGKWTAKFCLCQPDFLI